MIELISNIGKRVREIEGGTPSLVDLWVKSNKLPNTLFIIDIDSVSKHVNVFAKEVYNTIYTDSLIYAMGNVFIGSGMVIDKDGFTAKVLGKLNKSLEFLELVTDEDYLVQQEEKSTDEESNKFKLNLGLDLLSDDLKLTLNSIVESNINDITLNDGKIILPDCIKLVKDWLIDNKYFNLVRKEYSIWSDYEFEDLWHDLRQELVEISKASKKVQFSKELLTDIKLVEKALKSEFKTISKQSKNAKSNGVKAESSQLGFTIRDCVNAKLNELGVTLKGTDTLFCMIHIDGKTPRELFEEKFIDEVKTKCFKPIQGSHRCHECGKEYDTIYPTITYACFNNDKGNYSNVDGDGIEYGVCEDCLYNILVGKKFIEENLTGYWCGSSVMFLPYDLDELSLLNFKTTRLQGEKSQKLIESIRDNEQFVLEVLGETNTMMDIIFFDAPNGKNVYSILHTIKSVYPSRFTELANALDKMTTLIHTQDGEKLNKLTMYSVFKILTCDDIAMFNNIELLDIMFKGRKISREKFLSIALKEYRRVKATDSKGYAKYVLESINKVYKLFNLIGCLTHDIDILNKEGDVSVMAKYNSIEEFFERNAEYFDMGSKKAWFLLGQVYSYVVYKSKEYYGKKGEKGFTSHLEKNFVFGRTFNKQTFIYISNMCVQQLYKYEAFGSSIKATLDEINSLMASSKGRLGEAEAMHAFFWGLEVFIPKTDKSEEITVNKEITE